jgi:hypothetical protein
VHKSLCLIEYLIKYGPERFVTDVRLRCDVIRKLTYYKYLKNGSEVGAEVRSKAKTILVLLEDKTLLAEHREAAISTNQKIIGFSYRDSHRNAPSVPVRAASESLSERSVALASPEPEPEEFKEVVAPKPRRTHTEEIPEVEEEDDILAFARSNRRGSSNNFNASGIFSFEMPDAPASKPALLFDELFAGNEMALVVVAPQHAPTPVRNDMMLFDDAENFTKVVEEEKPTEPEMLMETEVVVDSETIPDDIWDFANVDNIRVTNSEKKRREHLLNKKRMMKGQKLKSMDKLYKMEMDHGLLAITYGESNGNAVVPYGMQYQQQPMYQQQQLVPYGYQHAAVQELHWN